MSIRLRLAMASLTVVIVLSGCAAPSGPESPQTESSAVSTDPGALLEEFTGTLCPAVVTDVAFNEVWLDQTSSLESIVTSATAARDASATVVAALEPMGQAWPEEYRADLQLVRELYVGKGADYATIAQASSLDELVNFVFADATPGNAAAQRIADALGEPEITC